ncbi:DUF317 domain-containing protein [Streptomyces sp. NPDC057654]|uniref:DUF317 domain-containing protein n=1 Tax=Streptomyces sp. NPDC057654 TaxID=3346196 RepID=UPI0036AB4932
MSKKQWPSWGHGEQAQQHYLVEPRALAGGGDVRHVHAFLRACGWRDKTQRGGPLALQSPDRTVRIEYQPAGMPGGWTIQGAAAPGRDAWWAHLGAQTPVEIVAGFTDALTQPRAAHAPNVWAPLREQRWRRPPETEHVTATSPDGSAWVQYRPSAGGGAMWWSGAQDRQGNGWVAQFTPSTPLHLVEAFTAALASPEPVMRPLGHVPHSARLRTTSVSVLPSQLGAWQQARITAARAATWASTAPRNARPRSTAARHHAPTGGARARH